MTRKEGYSRNNDSKIINTLIIYDVGAERVAKVHKFLSGHLFWEQRSVFSGNLSSTVLKRVLINLERFLDFRHDCVYCYYLRYPFGLFVERWGKRPLSDEIVSRL